MNSSTLGARNLSWRRFLPLGLVFFLSGCPALLYQLCWQRMLFTVYGVNIESITVVVSAFMLGLGLGSLWGGRLTQSSRIPPLLLFAGLELAILSYGLASPWILAWVGSATLGASLTAVAALSFLLVVIPTVLMGASLPLLVAHLMRGSSNVGQAIGYLYFVNTLGSAAACFLAAHFTLGHFGLRGTVLIAAGMNGVVALGALLVHYEARPNALESRVPAATETATGAEDGLVSFRLVLVLAALSGFISLSYEVLLARAYSFVSGGRATSFPNLLGWYLLGIAAGSLASGFYCGRSKSSPQAQLRVVGVFFFVVNLLGFVTVPLMSEMVGSIDFEWMYPLAGILSAGLGATLPLITHIGIRADQRAAERLSWVYLANIVGSTAGSLLTGFILMDHFGLSTITAQLATLGTLLSAALLLAGAGSVGRGVLLALCLVTCGGYWAGKGIAYDGIYERLQLKEKYRSYHEFADIVETRSGVVTVTRSGVVFGGGIYDGQLSTDLVDDRNGIVRPYILSAFQPRPARVLVIGLATGAWAQVLVNHPEVKSVKAIEINPGYLEVIRRTPIVASLLENQKFDVEINDGRRWLAANPEEKFDLIVMNTTFHYRGYASNLLSAEFLEEIAAHLNKGGLAIYNTTSSPEAQRTGASSFPHALRFLNNMIVSNDPLVANEDNLRRVLSAYEIDGSRVFDLNNPAEKSRLDEIVALLEHFTTPPELKGFERREDILERTEGVRTISDDNMGTEWTHQFD